METNITICKNCEKELNENFEFCPHCGQKTKDELTIGVLFYNTISNYFSFDARFFKSFIPLMFKPGILAKRFIQGKRLLYLHPAQMYLFISVIFFFLFAIYSRDSVKKFDEVLEKGFKSDAILEFDSVPKRVTDSIEIRKIAESLKDDGVITGLKDEEFEQLDSILKESTQPKNITSMTFDYDKNKVDSLIAVGAPESEKLKAMGMPDDAGFLKRRFYRQLLKFQEQSGKGILQAFYDSIPISLFVLLPIFALILKLFFYRRGSFAHHLVFSFYFFSFLFTTFSIILLAELIFEIPGWIKWLVFLSTFFYLFLAIRHFYQQGYIISFIKTSITSFIYVIIVIPIAAFLVVMGSFLFY
ncbi:DUF3667 domain-containing protein [Yeosuana sp. MJ-SS3]|uniref:DUF3667 domain-containing protein n=1 Tax=Gilvirhabdus luticola TaxID=3079858 RepID=A0ABU3U6Z4_9FLAO|nr:DUF3667 domain-containing protein [Yeosuana sp. MJ-SS3]MDU8886174.1 DUF3667 domain-containing protein [Yeosuana sp. MJ-SS3]